MRFWPFGRREARNNSVMSSDPWDALRGIFGVGSGTPAGVSISEDNAMTLSAVYACVRVLAETVASLPLKVYDRTGTGRKSTPGTPYYTLLHDRPNECQTSFVWRETAMAHALLWGNAYSLIVRNGRGIASALIPQDPWSVTPELIDGVLSYRLRLDGGGEERIAATNMLHIPALSMNGISGIRPISYWKNAMGLAKATEDFGSRFFANDSRPGIFIEMPGKLTIERQAALQKDFEEKYQGLGNRHRALIGEQGMKIHPVMIPPEDAQYLETRKFQVSEICRIFRVPPHMVADLEKATFSNIEHQDLAFAKHTVRPWVTRWEQELNFKLFPGGRSFAEYDLNGLLRGDFRSRTEGYNLGINGGWMTRNEARKLENFEPIAGLDEPLQPLNMVGAGTDTTNDGSDDGDA